MLDGVKKSNIPILVQAHDWAMLPESFHREIERDYVVQERSKQTTAGEWRTVALAEAPVEIIDGDRGKNYPKQNEFLDGGHCLFLNAGNVTIDGFNFSSCAFISAYRDERLKKGKLARHDVVLTTRGTIGNSAYFDEQVPYEHVRINSGMVILRALTSALHPRYLYFLTRSELCLSQIQALRTGSAQPQLPIRDIERIHIPIPPLSEQRAIAHILGTLDDKIELNRRMNETLEAMARAVFKSWFVDFDPVRAKMEGRWRRGESLPGLPAEYYDLFPNRLVDSELGEVPEGWEVKGLGDITHKPQYGYTESAKDDPVGPNFLRITDINKNAWVEWESVPYCEISEEDFDKYRLYKGDVLVARIADPGHGCMIEENREAVFASYLIRFRPTQERYARLLQYWLRSDVYWDLVRGRGTGTTRVGLNAKVLSEFPILVPSDCLVDAFAKQVDSLRTRVVANVEESRTLATQRGALLPELVSGDVGVGELAVLDGRLTQ